jgi:TolB-like protein
MNLENKKLKKKTKTVNTGLPFVFTVLLLMGCNSLSNRAIPEWGVRNWHPDGWRASTDVFERIPNGTLAVLPFAGGNGEDGETIAELFSFDETIKQVFTPMPRTSITAAMRNERYFQYSSGMTDPDSAMALGKEIGARYIIAGNIAKLGYQNLLVISILNTETLEQIAGDIQTYRNIEEITDKLPIMAQNIAKAIRRDTSELPKLAVAPFTFAGEDEARDVLAQILAVNFLRSGKYAIYPRTASLSQIQEEWNNQFSGDTADENIVRIGAGKNPRYVLSGAARRLGGSTMFNASIIDLESGAQTAGDSANYQTLNDGLDVMALLAGKLSGRVVTVKSYETFRQAIDSINASGWGNYFIIVADNIISNSPAIVDDPFDLTPNAEKIITITGDGTRRTIYCGQRDLPPAFVVKQGITLVLGNNLTLVSNNIYSRGLVWVSGGTLELRDGVELQSIVPFSKTEAIHPEDSAVVLQDGGILLMKGGIISTNYPTDIYAGGIIMSGGTINGDITGGFGVNSSDYIIKTGGTINGIIHSYRRNRNRQSGPNDNLDSRLEGVVGGWD